MAPRKHDPRRARLGDALRKTYDALFRHPAPHDLTWGEVIALLERLAEVRERRKGSFKVTRRGVLTTLRVPRLGAALDADELAEVKGFLERSEEGVSMPVVAEGTRLLVAIDSGAARIYRLEPSQGPPRRLEPFESNGYAALVRTSSASKGNLEPLRLGFYRDLARALRGAAEILLVGGGEDGSAALAALRAELRRDHPEIHRALVGALVHPGRRTSEAQLLARAREFYAARG